tara:strand:+ start:1641 stop:1832 length:192 start_codon:yes stop_codon:yes gene_type:complete
MTQQMNPLCEAEFITDLYLHHAVQSVDARLGEGYAKKNPQLVSTMVSLTATEHQNAIDRNLRD